MGNPALTRLGQQLMSLIIKKARRGKINEDEFYYEIGEK